MAIIKTTWKKMGVEFTYDVWYATNIDGPWAKHNTELLTDDALEYRVSDENNVYYLEGLKDNTEYFVKVTCNDRYYEWWYSYSDVDSIEGGYGSDTNAPVNDGGNYRCFQIKVRVIPTGYGITYGIGYA